MPTKQIELKEVKSDAKEVEKKLEKAALMKVPDGGYGWIIVLASFCLNIIVDGVVYTIGKPLQPIWVDAFNISDTSASLAVSILSACYYFTGPLASVLCDLYDCRRVAILGAVIATLGYIASALCPNIYFLYITFGIVVGIGYGLMYLPAIVVISQWFHIKRSLATGIAVCGSGIGTTLFANLNDLVLQLVDNNWIAFMVFLAIVSLFGVLFGSLLKNVSPSSEQVDEVGGIVKDYEVKKVNEAGPSNESETPLLAKLEQHPEISNLKKNPDQDISEIVEHDIELFNKPILQQAELCSINPDRLETAPKQQTPPKDDDKKSFRKALSNLVDPQLLNSPSFILLAFSGLLTMIAFYVPFIYLGETLKKIDGLSVGQISLPISMIGVVNVGGRILCGRLSDHPKMSALIVSAFAITLAGFATMLVPLFSAYWQFIAYTIPFSIGVASFGALRSVIAVELVGVEKLNTAFGILMVFMGVGCLIGSPLAAALKDITGNFDVSFYAMGAIMMISGVMLVPLQNIRNRELAKE